MEDHIQRSEVRQRTGHVVLDQLEASSIGKVRDVLRPPVQKLSTHTTAVPASSSRSQRWDPTKPAPPSTAARSNPRVAPLTPRLLPSAERRAHRVGRVLRPGGLLVDSCRVGSDPIP